MTSSSIDQALVVLNVPPSLEEPVIDWLLGLEQTIGFTSSLVFGHSARLQGLTPAEQVSGRQRRIQFEMQMNLSRIERFLDEAGSEFGSAEVHYWVIPVLSSGRLRNREEENTT